MERKISNGFKTLVYWTSSHNIYNITIYVLQYLRSEFNSDNESANLAISECIIFWEKTRIPTKLLLNCVNKFVKKICITQVWRDLQKLHT